MNRIRTSILGIAAAIGIAAVSLFSPVSVQPQAEAAVIILNTCTSTYQLTGRVPVLSGQDTVLVSVGAETGPVSWIVSVSLSVTVTNTQVIFTFDADTEVAGYYLIKLDSSGNTISTSAIITSDTCIENIIGSDTYYYYAVKAVNLAGNATGTLSESVAVGISSEGGLIFSPTTRDSTTIEVVCRDDDRVSVRIPQPKSAFGTEQEMMKLVVKKITRDALPVPKWAKNSGIATAYEVYCRKLSGASVTTFSAPVEITFAYDLIRGKVDGTNVRTADIFSRLAIFRWNGASWTRFASTIDLFKSTVWSQTYQLSHFVVGDVRALLEPGFTGYGAEPNPFTPNGDGINDVTFFKFTNDDPTVDGVLTIFDLNGAVIYTETIQQGAKHAQWDGYCNFGRTDLAEAGAYIWQAKIGNTAYNGIVVIAK